MGQSNSSAQIRPPIPGQFSRSGSGNFPGNEVHPRQISQIAAGVGLNGQRDNIQNSNDNSRSQVRQNSNSRRKPLPKGPAQANQGGNRNVYVDIRENKSSTQLQVRSYTWHRDSHGLFDYESKNVTQNFIKCNYSTILHRFENEILFEEMHAFPTAATQAEYAFQNMAAIILEKEGFYWLYHKALVEDDEEEKLHPADKAWLIVKFVNQTNPNLSASQAHYQSGRSSESKGYKLKIGDTVKFGRVRFKVIMMKNDKDGEQIFRESKLKSDKAKEKKKRRPLVSRMSLGQTESDEFEEEEHDHVDDHDLEEGHDEGEEDDEDEEEEEIEGEFEDEESQNIPGNQAPNNWGQNTSNINARLNQSHGMMSANQADNFDGASFLREHPGFEMPPPGRPTNFPDYNLRSANTQHMRKKKKVLAKGDEFLSPSLKMSLGPKKKSFLKNKESKIEEQSIPICRICLCEEEDKKSNPLITPCKCSGTMKHIHIECLREWLNSKSSFKESTPPGVKTYCWKALECELCKVRFPDRIANPEQTDQIINLIYFEKPDSDYLVLESVTQQNIKIIHVIDMNSSDFIKVGRGHDSQVRVTDISVSRFHAMFRKANSGDFVVEDNSSKFGTLVLVRRPYMLLRNCVNYFQIGRTLVECNIREPAKCCNIRQLCSLVGGKVKSFKKSEGLANDGEDYYPEEFMPKLPIEQTMEGEMGVSVLQKSVSVKLNSPNNRKPNQKLGRPNSRSNRANNSHRNDRELEINNAAAAIFEIESQRRNDQVMNNIQIENLNAMSHRQAPSQPIARQSSSQRSNKSLKQQSESFIMRQIQQKQDILQRIANDSPTAERLQPNNEEEKREDELENSQSFLNPLGNSLTDVSPAIIGNKKLKIGKSRVEHIAEEDEGNNSNLRDDLEESKHQNNAQNESAYSTYTQQLVHKIDAQRILNQRAGAQSESFKSDGQLKLSQIEKQLIEMQDGLQGPSSALNLGNRGTQDQYEHNNNLSIILVGDQSMEISQNQKKRSSKTLSPQFPLAAPQNPVNYWVDDQARQLNNQELQDVEDQANQHLEPETFLKPQVTISVLERPEDDWQVPDPHADAPGTDRGQLQHIISDGEEDEENTPHRLLQAEIEEEPESPDVINF